METESLPVVRIDEVTTPVNEEPWLIEKIWAREAVGIIGGTPKSCKTWLALDLSLSVASGTPALGTFPVVSQGQTLVYAAEDSLASIHRRILDIASARSLSLAGMPLWLIDSACLKLDSSRDLVRLKRTIDKYQPKLLVLDPLVRLHSKDENSAADISLMLGELRTLQREYKMAIILVHHMRKNGPSNQPGQSLRGSGDLHAWGDTNLYLNRGGDTITMKVEQRAAAAPEPLVLRLSSLPSPHLVVAQPSSGEEAGPDLEERVLRCLADLGGLADRETLREKLHVRNQSLGLVLTRLRDRGVVQRTAGGFILSPTSHPSPVPNTAQAAERNTGHTTHPD